MEIKTTFEISRDNPIIQNMGTGKRYVDNNKEWVAVDDIIEWIKDYYGTDYIPIHKLIQKLKRDDEE